MNFNTFYKIFYKHRFVKAKNILKLYLIVILPFKYFFNLFYIPNKIDLDKYQKNNNNLFGKNLNDLFDFFNSDKGNFFENQYSQPSKRTKEKLKAHGYGKFYEKYFEKIRNDKLNILEIGSFYGNASASFFFYFKNSIIYAADIFPDLFRYKSKRITNFFVNSSEEASISKNILRKNIEFDIIIEDAGHSLKDQIISIFMLFKNVKKGGLFIVEELEFPDTRDDMNLLNEKPTLREIFKMIKKNDPFNSKYISETDKKYFLENFLSIEIFKGNFNEIAVIKKK